MSRRTIWALTGTVAIAAGLSIGGLGVARAAGGEEDSSDHASTCTQMMGGAMMGSAGMMVHGRTAGAHDMMMGSHDAVCGHQMLFGHEMMPGHATAQSAPHDHSGHSTFGHPPAGAALSPATTAG